jgi:hypothetical protein
VRNDRRPAALQNAVIQSNNAGTDDCGYIYVADRVNTGLHIVELTGGARDRGTAAVVAPSLCGAKPLWR